jgi:hypothetical protein
LEPVSLLVRPHDQIAGTSLELLIPSQRGNTADGWGNDLGYGKYSEDWIIRSQVFSFLLSLGEVKWWMQFTEYIFVGELAWQHMFFCIRCTRSPCESLGAVK